MPRSFLPGFCPAATLAAFAVSTLGAAADTAVPAATAQAAGFCRVSLQNTAPRCDETGAIIDTHDGCLQFFAGRYYLYGTADGRSAGFGINNRFRAY